MLGLRRVEAHSSQNKLRLERLDRKTDSQPALVRERTQQSTGSPDQSQSCVTCDEPANMSRTSTGELEGLWLCRNCRSHWKAHGVNAGDESADVDESDTFNNGLWIEVKAKSRTKNAFIQTSGICRMNTTSSDSVS